MANQSPNQPSAFPRNILGWPLRLFSSIPLGVCLLTTLFVYASIGSAGLPVKLNILRPDAWMNVRELVEMSEFQWFHWWPFDVLIGLICLNIVVATLRRIPFNVINLGVWMIHSGILMLAAGSVWYFGTKLEGEAPVSRRMIVANLPGHEPVQLLASPGSTATVGTGSDAYELRVFSTTPDWELLSGDDAGKRAYKVSVAVRGPDAMFIRELLAGYPQYTEDLIASSTTDQPFVRAKKELGVAQVDDRLELALDYAPQEWFYLMETRALYLRELGSSDWVERRIGRMPLFSDRLASHDHVWPGTGLLPPLKPVDIAIQATHPDDPLPDVPILITDYLRYASSQSRRLAGGDTLNPAATVVIAAADGVRTEFELIAFDPARRSVENGALELRWVRTQAELDLLRNARPPTLTFALGETGYMLEARIEQVAATDPDTPFVPIGDSGYVYRVLSFENGMDIGSVARVEIRGPGETSFIRWVFDDPALTRDLTDESSIGHGGGQLLDENLFVTYDPGERDALRIVAGPEPTALRLLAPGLGGQQQELPLTVGTPIPLGSGAAMTVTAFSAQSRRVEKPAIVPVMQRDRDAGMFYSMIRVSTPGAQESFSTWLPYHVFPFRNLGEVPRRFRHKPQVFQAADGKWYEVVFSRERRRLPDPAVLESFEIETHVGGFSGDDSSILDWASLVRFDTDAGLTEPARVHVNNPVEHAGFWYFQSKWDPPARSTGPGDPGSSGLNYTILGVANRHGVLLQLLGCCLSVIGMLYAFYVKPYLKRRRQLAVYDEVAAAARPAVVPVEQPVGAGVEE